ncbi:hypothetical protein WG66_002246 [Moniliophthora roreri]|nr:hypothetical protein WG66_002246 [Moniliophthora roreri]
MARDIHTSGYQVEQVEYGVGEWCRDPHGSCELNLMEIEVLPLGFAVWTQGITIEQHLKFPRICGLYILATTSINPTNPITTSSTSALTEYVVNKAREKDLPQ